MISGNLFYNQPSTSAVESNVWVEIRELEFNRADTMEQCLAALEANSLPTFPDTCKILFMVII